MWKRCVIGGAVVLVLVTTFSLGLRNSAAKANARLQENQPATAPSQSGTETTVTAKPGSRRAAKGHAPRPPSRPGTAFVSRPSEAATPVAAPRPKLSADEVAQMVRALTDEQKGPEERRNAASALARDGSRDALAALTRVLTRQDAPSDLRAAVAEALGQCDAPEARDLLSGVLNDPD